MVGAKEGRALRGAAKAELTVKQRMAAELLGMGASRREVAAQVGVAESTLRAWGQNLAFCRARDQAMESFVRGMCPKAWEALVRQLEDEDKRIVQQAAERLLKLADGLESLEKGAVQVVFLHMPPPGEAASDAD